MVNTSENKPMKQRKQITVGILAHVDAGKTTLSEALLYLSGNIRKAGRVDNGDAFLDTFALERERGITIFSKQAILKYKNLQLTLLDTPGHVDFSAEMERTLQVLDYAVLVISGADGVQGHTQTLWRLLKRYGIPAFLFVNKMDQPGTDPEQILAELKSRLDENCVQFPESFITEVNDQNRSADLYKAEKQDVGLAQQEAFYEAIAMCGETALEQFLETGMVERDEIRSLIKGRKLFLCFFGSALKMQGVEAFLRGLEMYTKPPEYLKGFGAKVFKIARDDQGNRLTYLKITGGSLKVKSVLKGSRGKAGECWEEKVNQIRIYSGEKYETVSEAGPGTVCAVTGLCWTHPGEGLGDEEASGLPVLEPVLTYRIELPEGYDAAMMLPKLRQLEEEEPELHIVWNEQLSEIHAQVMGEVQIEILKSLVEERFGVSVEFGTGNIVYKETISNTVEGVGHFEPLRHYAEVHLLLEPGEAGSGMQFASVCSEDMLDKNWQKLILTHLEEREHKGVLTGAAITDMKITLVAGRAHIKHTEGGDFRQATYRAVRQGLKQAESILLEPYYEFRLEVPESMIGRAMTDIEKMNGKFLLPERIGELAMLTGSAPVISMRGYQKEVIAYTRGRGRLFCTLKGYEPCHNTEEVLAECGYDSERDTENPTGSVFCAHGAGFTVSWDRVKEYMHIESQLYADKEEEGTWQPSKILPETGKTKEDVWIGTDEIDRILNRTYNANKRKSSMEGKNVWKLKGHGRTEAASAPVVRNYQQKKAADEYLLVDGYNIIFAWEELKSLAEVSIDGARGKLLDILSNYQGIRGCYLIVVFDAYRVEGHKTETLKYHNIHVVYTKEAETADQYIEKFAHENGRKYRVTVATSDGLEQIIIRGSGCELLSARDLLQEIAEKNIQIQQTYANMAKQGKNYFFDGISEDAAGVVETIRQKENSRRTDGEYSGSRGIPADKGRVTE